MSAPAPPETRVVAGRVLCDLESGATRRDAAIVAENGRIVRIEAAPQDPASRALIALPAVVNAHDHGYGTPPMAFGAVDDALEPWICGLGGRPPTDPYLEAAVAFARMALGGISATVHCHNSFKAADLLEESAAVSRAAEDVGLRVAFSCPILDRNPWVYGGIEAVRSMFAPGDWAAVEQWVPRYEPADQQIARVEEVARRHERDGFAVQYGPVGPQWCEDSTLEAIAEASAATGRRVHMHLLETRRQREWTDAHYPRGIVAQLDSVGLLSPRLTVAHGVWLSPRECALLAERGVTVAVNTSSNLRLRSGLAPVATFVERGLGFALGLDGMALDDDQDALRDLRLAALLHAGTDLEPRVPGTTFLEAATRRGAYAHSGERGEGALVPGARADVLCLDYGRMSRDVLAESADEIAVLMGRMSARYLASLHVGGRAVVRDGELVTVDLPALEAELTGLARRGAGSIAEARAARRIHRETVRRFYQAGRHR